MKEPSVVLKSFSVLIRQLQRLYVCAYSFASVLSNSLRPHVLQPTGLPCPWDFPSKNTVVGCHALLQEIFPTQELNLYLLHLLHWQAVSLPLMPTWKPTRAHIYLKIYLKIISLQTKDVHFPVYCCYLSGIGTNFQSLSSGILSRGIFCFLLSLHFFGQFLHVFLSLHLIICTFNKGQEVSCSVRLTTFWVLGFSPSLVQYSVKIILMIILMIFLIIKKRAPN